MGAAQSSENKEENVKQKAELHGDSEEKEEKKDVQNEAEDEDEDEEMFGNPAARLFHLLKKNEVDVNAVREILNGIKQNTPPEKNILNMHDLPPTIPEGGTYPYFVCAIVCSRFQSHAASTQLGNLHPRASKRRVSRPFLVPQ